ncbi:MAG: hypothetical protein AAGD14_13635 [Planctomycetota bacterium]
MGMDVYTENTDFGEIEDWELDLIWERIVGRDGSIYFPLFSRIDPYGDARFPGGDVARLRAEVVQLQRETPPDGPVARMLGLLRRACDVAEAESAILYMFGD